MTEFCPNCRKKGICQFDQEANKIAGSPAFTPEFKAELIASERPIARGKMCPKVNIVNPWYEGKNDQ